mgnify:CR=1 FL=1|tara:strand:+ start:1401 stop:1985 length:585 start_codon:yes stop_codon:yes gene_type:complete
MKLSQKEYDKLKQAAKNITNNSDEHEDLLHECLVALFEKDESLIESLRENKALQFYCVRILMNMWNSSTSSYHYKYRFQKKFLFQLFSEYSQEKMAEKNHLTPTIQEMRNDLHNQFLDNAVDSLHEILDELYWYDAELFKLYKFGSNNGKKWTLNTLAEKTGISRTSIFDTTNRVMKYLDKRMKEETTLLNYDI